MKKLISLLAVFMLTFIAGCSAPAPVYDYGEITATWPAYESATYQVNRYYHLSEDHSANSALAEFAQNNSGHVIFDADNKGKILIGSGELEYTISAIDDISFKVTSDLSFTYVQESLYTAEILKSDTEYARFTQFMRSISNDADRTENKFFGKTDTVHTELVCSSTVDNTFGPLKVSKSFDQASTGDALQYTYDYAERKYTADYNGTELSRTFKAKAVANLYDSEQLFLFFRLLRGDSFTLGSSISLSNVTNWTDNIVNNSDPAKLNFTGTAASATVNLTMPELAADLNTDVDVFSALKVTLNNNSSDRKGPNIEAYYDIGGLIKKGENKSTRILLKSVQNDFDVFGANNAIALSTEYDLQSVNYDMVP